MKRVDIFLKKYYTDWHDVDEDRMTITRLGSGWTENLTAGVMKRELYQYSSDSALDVASSNI